MRFLIYIFILIIVVSCKNEDRESLLKHIWISDSYTMYASSILYSFTENKCYNLHMNPDYDKFEKIENEYTWSIIEDTLFLKSNKTTDKYLIHFITKDSLKIENINNIPVNYCRPLIFYSIPYIENTIDITHVNEFLKKGSFTTETSNSKYQFDYTLLPNNKCISEYDKNYQLEFWETIEIDSRIFLIFKHGITTVIYLVMDVDKNRLKLDFTDNGKHHNAEFTKTDEFELFYKELLINTWNYSFDSIEDYLPSPPPVLTKENTEYYNGIKFKFYSDSTYYRINKYREKKGYWNLSSNYKFILLDSTKTRGDIIKVDEIDSKSLTIIGRDEFKNQIKMKFYKE